MSVQADIYHFDQLTAMGGGVIGLGCCPGHRLTPWAVRPYIHRLDDDLRVISEWKPSLALSLMESGELAYVGVAAELIRAAVEAGGGRWVHAPIPNLREPDHRFERNWPALFKSIQSVLNSGGRMFIHCYAGLGRTGTVAARILIECEGRSAADAIEQVRAVRPGSVETSEQERYLFALPARRQG